MSWTELTEGLFLNNKTKATIAVCGSLDGGSWVSTCYADGTNTTLDREEPYAVVVERMRCEVLKNLGDANE